MAKEEYNWLDDPFDEKKNAQDGPAGMGKGSRAAFVLALVAAAALIVLAFVLILASVASFASL